MRMEGIGEDPTVKEDMRFMRYRVGWIGGHRQLLSNALSLSTEKRKRSR